MAVAGWADGEVLADQSWETGTGVEGKGVPEATYKKLFVWFKEKRYS